MSIIWPYFLLMTYFSVLASFIGRITRWSDLIPAKHGAGQFDKEIEGLRGVLAISVFFHHGVISWIFVAMGVWADPPSRFYAQLGPFAVTMFFFITGYLFWRKLSKAPNRIRYFPFIKNRLRRLFPAYLASVGLIFGIYFAQYGYKPGISWSSFVARASTWLFCGLPYGFQQISNLHDLSTINAYIFWTLRTEWLFYLVIPLLGWFTIKHRVLYLFVLAAMIKAACHYFEIHTSPNTVYAPLIELPHALSQYFIQGFSVGILTAHAKTHLHLESTLRKPVWCLFSLSLWLAVMLIVPTGYNLFLTALLAPIFLTIAHGNNYLGILGKPTAFLGTISYSVYLLHGIVLYVCTHLASRFVSYGNLYSLRYWMFIAGTGTLVIVAATLSYRYIEYPWMAKPAKTTL